MIEQHRERLEAYKRDMKLVGEFLQSPALKDAVFHTDTRGQLHVIKKGVNVHEDIQVLCLRDDGTWFTELK